MTALASRHVLTRTLPVDRGRISWHLTSGTAAWSDSVHGLHGYQPGQMTPSTALIFEHKHPADLEACVDAIQVGLLTQRLIVHEHRLIDDQGQTHPVVLIARPLESTQCAAQSLHGFLLPTDASVSSADHVTSSPTAASLVPMLMDAFQVSAPTAEVLLAVRMPLTVRRTPQQRALVERYLESDPSQDLRQTLEESWFPLDYLTLGHLDLAA